MRKNSLPYLFVIGAILAAVLALTVLTRHDDPPPFPTEPADLARAPAWRSEPLAPLPAVAAERPDKVALGERLFHDPVLSSDRTISCASCHDLERGATDRLARSIGVGGATGVINAPSLFNRAFDFVQFWDGRAATLEEQVAGPLLDPREMASSWEEAIGRLQADASYRAAFAGIYPEGITPSTVSDAIGSFERTLVTPDAPFDRYLAGDRSAIPPAAIAGYALFKSYGCASCHQGVNAGGNLFQRFGVMGDYFADRGAVTRADLGRFNVTGRDEDRHVFKVPSLRNVAATPPYFHDGSAADLPTAVTVMGRYQLGRELDEEDVRLLVAFLETLSGRFRGVPVR